jgi:glycosyltransferase involved in cell wall biosynthesis
LEKDNRSKRSGLCFPNGFFFPYSPGLTTEWINIAFRHYRTSRSKDNELFSDVRSSFGCDLPKQLPPADVYNLHWIAGFVDYKAFYQHVHTSVPIVWTLHDMNPFTGGCHFDNGCGKYEMSCGGCPQLGSSKNKADLSRQIYRRKRKIFGQIRAGGLHIVAPSRWLAQAAKRSSLLGKFPITTIPYGLDCDVFSPRDQSVARAALEIPARAKVVLFVADYLNDKRKGFALMNQALEGLKNLNNLFLICLGRNRLNITTSIPHISPGYIEDDRLLALIYSAADIYAIPSLQDNLPNTVLESLACAIPIVGFKVGGISDMIKQGVTGLLAPPGDISAFRNAMASLLKDASRLKSMAEACRRLAVEAYSLKLQAQRYVTLYRKISANWV